MQSGGFEVAVTAAITDINGSRCGRYLICSTTRSLIKVVDAMFEQASWKTCDNRIGKWSVQLLSHQPRARCRVAVHLPVRQN